MREYCGKNGELKKVICNMCGNEVKYHSEGYVSAEFVFGYFSRKDGLRHRFDLCEDCYDKMTARFRIPVECREVTELV